MYEQLEVALLGLATIFDMVLLVILFERVNANQVAVWLRVLVIGVFAIHVSSFLRAMQQQPESIENHTLDRVCFGVTAFGLLLLPSAMVHVAIRLNHTGPIVRPSFDVRYAAIYLPLLCVPLLVWDVSHVEGGDFLTVFANLLWPYMAWLLVANVTAILLFLRVRKSFEHESIRAYFVWHSMLLSALTGLAFAYVLYGHSTSAEPLFRLAAILSPLAPLFLFVWYSLKARLLSLVMERTMVYGAVLLAIVVFFRATLLPWLTRFNARSDFDWLSVEIMVAALIVLAWKPLRVRVLESLRYLLSNNVFRVRDATRKLSVQLTKLSSLPACDLIDEFESAICNGIDIRSCKIAIFQPEEWKRSESDENCSLLEVIANAVNHDERGLIAREWGIRSDIATAMEQLDVMWAFRIRSGLVGGVVCLGPRNRCDRLADEQLTALSLLFEQFASILENRWIDAQRIRAERMAMHKEKLTALGLMSSSLAHEIRNPLSSIRTIAKVAMEECPQNSTSRKDLEIILSEIDRLTCTTQQLLNFARPNEMSQSDMGEDRPVLIAPKEVIENAYYVLNHLAKQSNIALMSEWCDDDIRIPCSQWMLSEVVFNLLRNAIEAAQGVDNGMVTIRTRVSPQNFVIEVSDNGPGIPLEAQKTMYQPFVTGKKTGTGLGLYIVQDRVKEMRGTLQCESQLGHGTIFRVLLPRTLE